MANNSARYVTTVELNSQEATNKLKEMEANVKKIRSEMDKAYSSGNKALGDKLSKDLSKATKEMKTFAVQTMDVDKVLKNLSDASINQLAKAAKSLNAQLKNIPANTEKYREIANQLQQVRTRQAELRSEMTASKGWMSTVADGFNRWQGAIIAFAGSITGLTMTIRKTVQDYADMEEAMADVRKYTGLADEGVRELNEDLRQMDTRTTRERLNELAGDAGRLGIQGKEAILEFVDAADKINVALGDDLGEGAVRDIGKLSETFGDSDNMGLRGAMLATGSAVNELAQSSSAAAGYIVDFTARLAGVGTQAGFAQTQIMGFASVLDQNMQQQETAATALSQLISKMYQDPAKFAKLAGEEVSKFTNLLKTDANAALIQFLQKMQAKGGFDALAPMFKEMGLSGTRATGILSTLATNIEEVKKQQDIAAKAFKQGTSVLDEYNVQNNTVQAGIDKAKKHFHEISIALGEKLLPVVRYTISGGSLLVKSLNSIIETLVKCRATIIMATAALATFYLQAKMTAILNALSTAVTKCTTAFRALAVAIKSNPWAAAATAIALVAGALIDYATNSSKAAKAQKELSTQQKITAEATEATKKAVGDVTAKYSVLQTQWRAMQKESQKLQWIKDNQAAFAALGLSVKSVNDANSVFIRDSKKVAAALKAQAEANVYSQKYEEAISKKADYDRRTNGRVRVAKATNGNLTSDEKQELTRNGMTGKGGMYSDEALKQVTAWRIQEARKQAAEERKIFDEEIVYYGKKMTESADKVSATATNNVGGGGGGSDSGGSSGSSGTGTKNDPVKEAIEKSKQIAAAEKAEDDVKYATGKENLLQHQDEQYRIKRAELERELAIYQEGTKEYQNVLNQRKTLDAKYQADLTKQDEQAAIQLGQQRQFYIDESYSRGLISQEAYNEATFQNDVKTLQERMNAYESSSEEYKNLQEELTNRVNDQQLYKEQEFQQKLADFRRSFLSVSKEEEYNMTVQYADQLHEQGLLSEQEYQEAIKAIKDQYQTGEEGGITIFSAADFSNPVVTGVADVAAAIQSLDEPLKKGEEKWKRYASVAAGVAKTVNAGLQQLGNYYAAEAEAEIATTKEKYARLIAEAEGNEEEQQRLEKERDELIAKRKIKQYKSERNINIATALMNTALSITKGYAEYGPIIGSVLAAVSVAMGALQVATINKQYEAQVAAVNTQGYYEGGYTNGKKYKKEAGVVHEGEFVANHEAVNNPDVRPTLDLIDAAQRNNSVGSLTREDLAAAAGVGNVTVEAPAVTVNQDNSDIRENLQGVSEAIEELNRQLDKGVKAYSVISGPEGSYQKTKDYEKLLNNK